MLLNKYIPELNDIIGEYKYKIIEREKIDHNFTFNINGNSYYIKSFDKGGNGVFNIELYKYNNNNEVLIFSKSIEFYLLLEDVEITEEDDLFYNSDCPNNLYTYDTTSNRNLLSKQFNNLFEKINNIFL